MRCFLFASAGDASSGRKRIPSLVVVRGSLKVHFLSSDPCSDRRRRKGPKLFFSFFFSLLTCECFVVLHSSYLHVSLSQEVPGQKRVEGVAGVRGAPDGSAGEERSAGATAASAAATTAGGAARSRRAGHDGGALAPAALAGGGLVEQGVGGRAAAGRSGGAAGLVAAGAAGSGAAGAGAAHAQLLEDGGHLALTGHVGVDRRIAQQAVVQGFLGLVTELQKGVLFGQ